MISDCREMRRRIESIIGYALGPDERDEIEKHCAGCESCRTYRERLLQDDSRLTEFAAPRAQSIRNVQERAIERVRTAEPAAARGAVTETARPQSSRSGRVLARIPRIAAIAVAVAAVIIVFMVIDLIRGAHNGPVPAFAAVQEKMQKFNNVVFRLRLWKLGQWTTCEEGKTSSWLRRDDYGDSIIFNDFVNRDGWVELRLYPAEKRAVISRMVSWSPTEHDALIRHLPDPLDNLAAWYKAKGFSFIRKDRLNGKNTAVYEKYPNVHNKEAYRLTAWVDLDTELPVRFEMVAPRPNPNSEHYNGLRLTDFQTEGSKTSDWIDLKAGEPVAILDNFKWNASLDTSYFSLVPPAGYGVETRTHVADSCIVQGRDASETIAWRLSNWLSLSGNIFPDDLQDLTDSSKVKRLLLAKFHRGGDPAEEFRAAYNMSEKLRTGAILCGGTDEQFHIYVHYTGKGATFGDSKRIVCWLKDENEPDCPNKSGNGPYFLIYGDLHIADSPTLPKSARE